MKHHEEAERKTLRELLFYDIVIKLIALIFLKSHLPAVSAWTFASFEFVQRLHRAHHSFKKANSNCRCVESECPFSQFELYRSWAALTLCTFLSTTFHCGKNERTNERKKVMKWLLFSPTPQHTTMTSLQRRFNRWPATPVNIWSFSSQIFIRHLWWEGGSSDGGIRAW